MGYDIRAVLHDLRDRAATRAHLKAKTPVYFRMEDALERTDHPVPSVADMEEVARILLDGSSLTILTEHRQVDTVHETDGERFRVSFFRQRGTLGLTLRFIPPVPGSLESVDFPDIARPVLESSRGVLLIAGAAGSGKTTTTAAILQHLNARSRTHIVTFESPVEYVIRSEQSVVTQREVGPDTASVARGLRQVLRQDPDVIMVSTLANGEIAGRVLEAADTGILVISTISVRGAVASLEHLVGLFPAGQHRRVHTQLSLSLQGVLAQGLVPRADGRGRIAVHEVLIPDHAMRDRIRHGQMEDLARALEETAGCRSQGQSLQALMDAGRVTEDAARAYREDEDPI